ncbi:DUF7507 domain-containing protein [Streptomyces profundus]|uniref:DUF7507 domain-containing protein n=1 Tax=Streptomyces profundus TaxID=2867410 RepID=UPI001D165658|nr:DUF11 domain-containing protein [Streptomyces sp. MA3_2.13]UED84882.1 DUF11 domain-containing protein [Streptomyces sp. MA3_2.13]
MLGASPLLASPAVAQPGGPPLVDETFTGASADPDFLGFGSACLTGAPIDDSPPGPGAEPLGGCPSGSTGPVPPPDGAPFGYLRLTDAATDQAGAALYEQAIPSGAGLHVTFEQWQYGGTTDPPADGISFFLIDGAATLDAPGAFGGSLGYAQKLPDDDPSQEFLPGVNQGYLGVGLDVLGNFFGDWEQRGNGCAERSPAGTEFRVPPPGPNMVTVRGPGNGTDGYCFLTATADQLTTTPPWNSTLPGELHGPTTALPPDVTPEEAETLLEPSRRTVTVEISPTPDPVLTVAVDFHDGAGSQRVLSTPAPQPVPDSYKFGFAGSTGLFTDVHLIRNVAVHPVAELPRLSVVKQIAEEPPLPEVLPAGTVVPYTYLVTNGGDTPISGLAVLDDRAVNVVCPRERLWPGESMTCTGEYVITQDDVGRGTVTNTAVASGVVDHTVITSPPDRVTLDLGSEVGLGLSKSVDDSRPYEHGEPVVYRYTVTNLSDEPVSGVVVTDDLVADVTCPSGTLAPGESTHCTGRYLVGEHKGDCGRITNTAVASTEDGALRSAPDTATITVKKPCGHRPK